MSTGKYSSNCYRKTKIGGKSPTDYYLVASSDVIKGLSDELLLDRELSLSEIPEWLRNDIIEPEDNRSKGIPKTLYGYTLKINEDCKKPCFLKKSQALPNNPLPFDDLPIAPKDKPDGSRVGSNRIEGYS